MTRIIINGDDFGSSNEINKAIIYAFEKKLISTSTIMTNMPGFDEACEFIHSYNLQGKIGIHLNLSEGCPLTKEMALCRKFCNEKREFYGVRNTVFWLKREEQKIVQGEFQAQIDKLKEKGIIPTHIDSHHHYHTEWAIGNEVIKVAKRNGIEIIRIARNCGETINNIKLFYKILYNFRLNIYGFAKVKYFGSIDDILTVIKPTKDIEIMVHPGFDEENKLIDLTNGKRLEPLIHNVKKSLNVEKLTTYNKISY